MAPGDWSGHHRLLPALLRMRERGYHPAHQRHLSSQGVCGGGRRIETDSDETPSRPREITDRRQPTQFREPATKNLEPSCRPWRRCCRVCTTTNSDDTPRVLSAPLWSVGLQQPVLRKSLGLWHV